MLCGLVAGLLAFAFARLVGEPEVERAIAFETHMDQMNGVAPEPEMINRKVQKGLGLFTGVMVYGTALGGLFGLAFALAWGRLGITHPRMLSAVVAGLGFVNIVLVPTLKYPANPPSVGNPETIGVRTGAFFLLIAFSVAASILALQIQRGLHSRYLKGWNASLASAGLFVLIMVVACHFMPPIDEVPAGFPASLLWRFRVAGLEMQAVMWTALGLLFGWLTERSASA